MKFAALNEIRTLIDNVLKESTEELLRNGWNTTHTNSTFGGWSLSFFIGGTTSDVATASSVSPVEVAGVQNGIAGWYVASEGP